MDFTFKVDDRLKVDFPDHKTAVFGPIEIKGPIHTASFDPLKDACKDKWSAEAINTDPIIRHWRQVFKIMGAKPKYASSVEELAKSFVESGKQSVPGPRQPIDLVSLYNWVSLAAGVPMAAYDATAIRGALTLRYAKKGEDFTPLTQPTQTEKTKNGEVIYADDVKVICRYWNLGDCHSTRITPATRTVVFIGDLLDGPHLQTTADEITMWLSKGLSLSPSSLRKLIH